MSIKNEGEIHSKVELDSVLKENQELKEALGESTLAIKVLKKKVRNGSSTKQEIEGLAEEFQISLKQNH